MYNIFWHQDSVCYNFCSELNWENRIYHLLIKYQFIQFIAYLDLTILNFSWFSLDLPSFVAPKLTNKSRIDALRAIFSFLKELWHVGICRIISTFYDRYQESKRVKDLSVGNQNEKTIFGANCNEIMKNFPISTVTFGYFSWFWGAKCASSIHSEKDEWTGIINVLEGHTRIQHCV